MAPFISSHRTAPVAPAVQGCCAAGQCHSQLCRDSVSPMEVPRGLPEPAAGDKAASTFSLPWEGMFTPSPCLGYMAQGSPGTCWHVGRGTEVRANLAISPPPASRAPLPRQPAPAGVSPSLHQPESPIIREITALLCSAVSSPE